MKVILADDDKNVITCLRKLIDWEALGMEIVGEASNGENAYKIIKQLKPDIVITDIKMPSIDGLELCKLLYKEMFDVKTIILSGYEDFEFAQKAIRYGVVEYILKPLDNKKIELLRSILVDISNQKKKKGLYNEVMFNLEYQNEIVNRLRILDNEYFENLFIKILEEADSMGDKIKNFCAMLIGLLYSYLENLGFSHSVVEFSKFKDIDYLNGFKVKKDIIELTKSMYDKFLNNSKDTNNYYNGLVDNVIKYIDNNYSNPNLCVNYIGNKFKFSADYLTRIFRKITKVSISEYLLNIRIEKAVDLLNKTDISVNDISLLVGYNEPNYFAKVFKKHKGVSPSDYRRQISSISMNVNEMEQ